jgi:hypothetical protein
MEKVGEINQKLGNFGQNVNQTFAPRPKHDRMWA